MKTLKDQIKTIATSIGYEACGIAGAEPFVEYRQAIQRFSQQFPESADLYQSMDRRTDPRARNPWAKSIVACIRLYGKYAIPESVTRHIGRSYLGDRRIEGCPDHIMPRQMKDSLKALGLRVKVGGVPSREAAVRAGVAQIGKNGFAFAAQCGSWNNIESWLIDAELEPDRPAEPAPCPSGCRACLNACRTGALAEPYVMNMKRCIAYLTYEAPRPLPEELEAKMGPWIYGCDDCQRVCPMNQGQWEPREPTPWLDRALPHLTPESLATMDQETFSRVIYPILWYIPESDLARWHANAKRALGQ